MLQAMPRRKNSRGDFGRLLKAHRERLGVTMNELARQIPLDQGYLSKVERALRPPPQIVPHVQRIAAALGFRPDSAEFQELIEAAYRERFPRKQKPGISEILTVTAGADAETTLRRSGGLSGISSTELTVDASLPKPAFIPANLAQVLDASPAGLQVHRFLDAMAPRGFLVLRWAQEGETAVMDMRLPSGKGYRAEIHPLS
jgi:transcriptional regulator with XRE-family HTH domain